MQSEPSRRVQILRDSVARKIAAGEVIDRPLSVVRELLDNAIDAGASEVMLSIESGGISSIRVVDDGSGMSKEDLELCWLPHATSKIETEDELATVRTLGFRGEALASIAACARLRITSAPREAGVAHRLAVESGKLVELGETPGKAGTVVEVADLFYAMPGRRRFLKAAAAESALCRTTFVEKALPFPYVAFRFTVDGELRLFLPAHGASARAGSGAPDLAAPDLAVPDLAAPDLAALGEALRARVCDAHPAIAERSVMRVMTGVGEGVSGVAVAGSPALFRKDRRFIQVFVNGRRLSEFALVQAVEYGYSRHLPGGRYPVAFLFLSIDPALVDFNIHPAKREARFRNARELHHFVTELIKGGLAGEAIRFSDNDRPAPEAYGTRGWAASERSLDFGSAPGRFTAGVQNRIAAITKGEKGAEALLRRASGQKNAELEGGASAGPEESGELSARRPIRFLGQLFGLFLAAEVGDRLFLVDQHAAHERILFEELVALRRGPQRLLIPLTLDIPPEESQVLLGQIPAYSRLGIEIERLADGRLQVVAIPPACATREALLVEFLEQNQGGREELEQTLFAMLACRSAIKDGDNVDDRTAVELIRAAFRLPDARCPHGRPIWFELSREELYRAVGRIV